ncbi:hypothetical protein BDQ12DRAFT_667106 [Crucibulum laeve]|uniref:Uncharacterized protein n=1 Tax=Crucibulum laeve TaxID=68775 RepID=A0A5C3LYE4_9AGAR|nr:hypothetical protein BDQ12DRAFT_667106 [Crucibulum laeve]
MTYTTTTSTSATKSPRAVSFVSPTVTDGSFAFARIKGDLCLVQVSYDTPMSALSTVDVKIFRHEFITIFRFVESRTLHPADITIVESIDDRLTRYEEENDTVFLAKDLMDRMRKMTDPRRTMQARRSQMQRYRQR